MTKTTADDWVVKINDNLITTHKVIVIKNQLLKVTNES